MPTAGHPVFNALQKAQESFRAKVDNAAVYDDMLAVRTIDDLLADLTRIQQNMAKKGNQRFMGSISRYLNVLDSWSPAIEQFVQVKPELLALIWGPIKVVLRLASEHGKLFSTIAGAFEMVGDSVPQFDLLVNTFSDRAELGQALVRFYENLLHFYHILLSLTRESFNRKVWLNTLWPTFSKKLEEVVEKMREQAMHVRNQATVLDLQESRASRIALQSGQDRQGWAELQASAAPEFHDERLNWYRNRAVASCADWLFSDDQFCQWVNPLQKKETAAWLFLHGIPGAGKTHLAVAAVDYVRKTVDGAAVQGPCVVLFALVSNINKTGLSAVAVLQSLLFQAAEDDPSLRTKLLLESRLADLRSSLPHITDRLRGFFLQRTTPSDAAVGTAPVAAYIVIDGLDEMDEDERQLLLHNLGEVARTCKNLRVMISSRAEDDIARQLQGRHSAASIRVDDKNHGSIKTYVNKRLRDWADLRGFGQETETEIRRLLERLPEIANGMFLYTRIILDNLKHMSGPDEIKNELKVLPANLDEAYDRIFQRINQAEPSMKEKCRKVLGWIDCAPTPLTVQEMEQAILVQAADAKKPQRHAPKVYDSHNTFVRLCGSIVEVVGDDRLQFVHFTVTSYIFSSQVRNCIDRIWAGEELAACLLAYLASGVLALPTLARHGGDDDNDDDDDDEEYDDKQIDSKILAGDYRLLQYAAMQWPAAVHPLLHPPEAQNGNKRQDVPPQRIRKFLARLAKKALNDGFEEAEGDEVVVAEKDDKSHLFHSEYLARKEPQAHNMLCATYRFHVNDRRWFWSWANGATWENQDPLQTSRVLIRVQNRLAALADKSGTDAGIGTQLKTHYGPRLFKCPRAFCMSSLRGFETLEELTEHRRGHGRQWKCREPTCPYYQAGFLTRGMLDEHIQNMLEFHPIHSYFAAEEKRHDSRRGLGRRNKDHRSEEDKLKASEIECLLHQAMVHSDSSPDEVLERVRQLCALPGWKHSSYGISELQLLAVTEYALPVMADLVDAISEQMILRAEKENRPYIKFLHPKVVVAAIRTGNQESMRWALSRANHNLYNRPMVEAMAAERDDIYAVWTEFLFGKLAEVGVREDVFTPAWRKEDGNEVLDPRFRLETVFQTGIWKCAERNPLVRQRLLALLDGLELYLTPILLGVLLVNVSDSSYSVMFAEKLIQMGANVNFPVCLVGRGGHTPLRAAAKSTSKEAAELMRFLLSQGADPIPNPGAKIALGKLKGPMQIHKRLDGVTWDQLVKQYQHMHQPLHDAKREKKKQKREQQKKQQQHQEDQMDMRDG